jgi:hypothetical protein
MIQSRPVTRGARYSGRRRALQRHGVPLVAAAVFAFGTGVVMGARHEPAERQAAERYALAWSRGDFAAMHGLLTDDARARTSLDEFRAAHERRAVTATATRLIAGEPRGPEDGEVRIPVRVATRMFGEVRTTLALPIADDDGQARVAWSSHLAFPGVRRGEELTRRTRMPPRATLVAADGTVLARGADRAAEDVELAASIRGEMGPIPAERAEELRAAGVPPDAQVGLTGLERALDDELRGRPGGELLAGGRRASVRRSRRASSGPPSRRWPGGWAVPSPSTPAAAGCLRPRASG